MTTFYVWTLVVYISGSGYQGGPTVIDNISTMEECQRVAALVLGSSRVNSARCFQIQKVKP